MGLPARQRRVLDRIEGALRGSDPRLAALYSIFARLTRDEDMPRIEQLRHRAVLALSRARRWLASAGAVARRRLVPRPRAVLLFPLALCLAAASIVFAIRAGHGPRCTPVMQVSATSTHPAASKLCRGSVPLGYLGGH
jgi:hypothetical protein